MELERKKILIAEISALQKTEWSYKDIMIFCHCSAATAVKKIKIAQADGIGIPGDVHHISSDAFIKASSKNESSKQRELDNRIAELTGFRPVLVPKPAPSEEKTAFPEKTGLGAKA